MQCRSPTVNGNPVLGSAILGNSLFKSSDKAGIAISSPMRVSDGDVTLTIPNSIDYSAGKVYRTSSRLDMGDAPSELDFEAFYNTKVKRSTHVGTYLTYRDTPTNDPKFGGGASVFATLGMKF